jgi:cellulose synthase (UDP-forming)
VYHEQALFYRLLQPGKNHWGAAFWCGTNAVVRTAALRDVGGIATETITEDIHTTIRFHRRGWKTIYHNEVLARGLAATTAQQYRLQRYRWGRGAMQVLRKENPLVVSGLSLRQRLAYAATLIGWFDAWRSLAYLLIPIAVLLTGAVPIRAEPLTFTAAFGATFFMQQSAMFLLSRGFYRPIMATMFDLVRMTPNMLATLSLLRPGSVVFKVTPKGREGAQRQKTRLPRLLALVAVASVVAGVWFTLTVTGITPLHYGVPWAAYGATFWLIVNFGLVLFGIRRVRSVRFGSERRRSVRFQTALTGALDGQPCRICDVSLTGARVQTTRGTVLHLSTETHLSMLLDGLTVSLMVSVRKRDALPGNRIEYGIEFSPDQADKQALLAQALFNGQVTPQMELLPEITTADTHARPDLAFA